MFKKTIIEVVVFILCCMLVIFIVANIPTKESKSNQNTTYKRNEQYENKYKEGEAIDDTDKGRRLPKSRISDEEIISKTKGYWYCDTEGFIECYRNNYDYRDVTGFSSYDNKEEELYDILNYMTYDKDKEYNQNDEYYKSEEAYKKYYEDFFNDMIYGKLLRYIDYLEESKQTDSECYKIATEVRSVYNGTIVDVEYFYRASEVLEKINPKNGWIEDYNDTNEQNEIEEVPVQKETKSTTVSVEQKQALKKAEQYIDIMGFSKEGLKGQLEYDGFEDDSIEYAVENVDVNWNEEALEKAEQYMDLMGFSKDGMRSQLEYDGFTDSEIEYAINNLY